MAEIQNNNNIKRTMNIIIKLPTKIIYFEMHNTENERFRVSDDSVGWLLRNYSYVSTRIIIN